MYKEKDFLNGSGCKDLTAYEAIKKIRREEKRRLIAELKELAESRGEKLYGLDAIADLRFSHENPSVQRLYKDFLIRPLSEKAHHLLHTDHTAWEMPLSPDNQKN